MMTGSVYETTKTRTYTYSYLVYEPADRAPDEKLPMIVFLHGAGERGTNPEVMKCHSIPKIFDEPVNYRCIVVCPQCPKDEVWLQHIDPLRDFIVKMIHQYNADPDAVSLTGISMGGFGSWELAMAYPDMFSCLVPVCGGGMSWRADRLKNLPIHAFHGEVDGVVPPAHSVEMVDKVNRAGGEAKLTIYPGVGHDSWAKAYASGVIDWMLLQRRK
ncbi:MAG: prolyl oligopeptidase family serine peptidase [Clostridia bacterium]|nr:prolyl oligopeptidase family serine peptidase [Clostridia bacterium]